MARDYADQLRRGDGYHQLTPTIGIVWLVEPMDPPLDREVIALEPAIKSNYNSPLIAKGHPMKDQLTRDFNKALRELVEDGIYEKLFKIHDLPIQYPHPDEQQNLTGG